MYEMIVEMEGLSVEILILGKHCAQLLCHSNGTTAVVVRPLEGRKGIYFLCHCMHVIKLYLITGHSAFTNQLDFNMH